MPPRKPPTEPTDGPTEPQDQAPVVPESEPTEQPDLVANPNFEVGTRPDDWAPGVQLNDDGTPPALTGDGAPRDEPDATELDDSPYGTVKVRSTGPTVVVHGHTLAVGGQPVEVPDDAETQEQVAAGLIAVVDSVGE